MQRSRFRQAARALFEQIDDVVAGVGSQVVGAVDGLADGFGSVGRDQIDDPVQVMARIHPAFGQRPVVWPRRGRQ